MRIAIATAVYYPMINGVAVFSHQLAKGLAQRGHEVMVLCPSQDGRENIKREDGVKVIRLKSIDIKVYPDQVHPAEPKKMLLGHELPRLFYRNGFRVSLWPSRAVQRALSMFQPEVVHVQVSDPIGLATVKYARQHQIPVVTTEHNQPEVLTDPLHLPKFLKTPAKTLLANYFVHRQKQSDFVTMPTEQAIKNLIYKHGQEFKVPVAAVSNGVDLSNFRPGKVSKILYQKYGITPNLPTVLYVGRVDPEKRVDLVLSAFAKMSSKVKAQLVVIGDGVALSDLKRQAKQLGVSDRVRFLGRVVPPELYILYRVGDVFATASEIETQGIVLIEAAATGLPLIAVDKGAVSEVCINGQNGFLCQPGDITGLSAAMAKILQNSNLRQKFSQNSLKIAQKHDLEHTLDQFLNIYRRVQKPKKPLK